MATAYLGLGSNLGDRLAMLRAAVARLAQLGSIRPSSVYETEPWGDPDQPRYLNLCCRLETALPVQELHRAIKQIECDVGRTPSRRWGPREIDVDLLTYDDAVVSEPSLSVPHPRIAERAFVLVPLAELAPDVVIPGLEETAARLLARIPNANDDVRVVATPDSVAPTGSARTSS